MSSPRGGCHGATVRPPGAQKLSLLGNQEDICARLANAWVNRVNFMKKFVWIITIALVAVIVYVAAGPYLTIAEIETGIAEKDSEKLTENIDFPLLRQNLKEQLTAAAMKNAATELENNPLAALAAGLATTLFDGVVDSFLTPAGLASIMEGKRPSESSAKEPRDTRPPKEEGFLRNARYSYDSLSKFSIWVPNDDGQEVRFVLQRNDFSWKLVNLVLPREETP